MDGLWDMEGLAYVPKFDCVMEMHHPTLPSMMERPILR